MIDTTRLFEKYQKVLKEESKPISKKKLALTLQIKQALKDDLYTEFLYPNNIA